MVHRWSGAVAVVEDIEVGGFDEADFELDLRVIEAAYPIAKLACDTSDGCGTTCSGSACNSQVANPS